MPPVTAVLLELGLNTSLRTVCPGSGNGFLEWQPRLHSEERSEGRPISCPTLALSSPFYLLFSFSAFPPSRFYAFCILWSLFLLTHVILVSRLTTREFYTSFLGTIDKKVTFISLGFLIYNRNPTPYSLTTKRKKKIYGKQTRQALTSGEDLRKSQSFHTHLTPPMALCSLSLTTIRQCASHASLNTGTRLASED